MQFERLKAAVKIQALVRAHQQRNNFKKLKQNTIMIQSMQRMHMVI